MCWLRAFIVGLLTVLGVSCYQGPAESDRSRYYSSANSSSQTESSPYFIAYPMAQVSPEALNLRFQAIGRTARNGIRIFRLVYPSSDLGGLPIRASGLLILPDVPSTTLPWISLQHVTITGEAQAPSNKPEEGLWEASQGFAVVVADQIGFGSSKGVIHPYLFQNAYPKVLIDALFAARAVIEAQGHEVGPLFLRGYSEGGYATLALQRVLETQYADEFPITASAPASGPYELELTAIQALSQVQLNPVNVSLLLLSYGQYLAREIDLRKVFAPNLDDIRRILDGRLTYEEALAALPADTTSLLRPEFVASFIANPASGEEAPKLRRLLRINSIFSDSWVPKTPTRFYHCADDEVVPLSATEYALIRIRALDPMAPVTSEIAPSQPSQPLRHGSCPLYYASVDWFQSLLR